MSASVEGLRTSELLRRASSELAATDAQLASELRVRTRWIESGRADEGVSNERRQALAMVDDPIDGADVQGVA
jgi:hypothetical protein